MIAFIADVHVGNHKTLGGAYVGRVNERFLETLSVLEAAVNKAASDGVRTLVVAGDLFDTDDPTPQEVQLVIGAMKAVPEKVLLGGNHELHSTAKYDNALAVLHSVPGFTVVDAKPEVRRTSDGCGLVLLPFRPGRAEGWIDTALASVAPAIVPDSVLVIHLGISDSHTRVDEPWMMGSHDQVSVETLSRLCAQYQFSAVVAGNWHQHMFWVGDSGALIYQLGALCPTGWNNQGGDDKYGTLAYWDVSSRSMVRHVIPGPRYLKFCNEADWAPFSGNELIRARVEASLDRVDVVQEYCTSLSPMGYVEVVPTVASTVSEAGNAVTRVSLRADSESDMLQYLHTIDADVDVGDLSSAVQRYLQKGKQANE